MTAGLEIYKEDGSLAFSTSRGDRPCYMLHKIPFNFGDFTAYNDNGYPRFRRNYPGLDPERMCCIQDGVTLVEKDTLQLYNRYQSYDFIYVVGW